MTSFLTSLQVRVVDGEMKSSMAPLARCRYQVVLLHQQSRCAFWLRHYHPAALERRLTESPARAAV